jgi:hypothetical protein
MLDKKLNIDRRPVDPRRVAFDGSDFIRGVAFDGSGPIRRVAFDERGLTRGGYCITIIMIK